MYSAIANTTFSYILTLNKFREAIPKEQRPSWVKVTTITMVSRFVEEVDIQKVRAKMTALKFYNQITLGYTDAYSNKSIKVFPNGSIQVAGCSDLFDCDRIIKQLSFILKILLDMEKSIPAESFKVVMINTNFSINYNINLFTLAEHFGSEKLFTVSFDPDRYSAVKIKFKPAQDMKQVTASVFSTGKIIVTGAETLKEIAYSYNIINQHILSKASSIKVGRVETIDTFDTILGYKFTDLVPALEKKGFKPWGQVVKNHEINF